MRLFALMDALFRDRNALYQQTADGAGLGGLFARLLLLFVASAALYGACMGSFRLFHSEFYFSDFEFTAPDQVVRGRVAGINPETLTVYTERPHAPLPERGEIRFNVSYPSEPIKVASVGQGKEFGTIVLAPGTVLEEASAWRIPLLVLLKTPLLFVLTLLICAPALYVINLALDVRLHFMPVMTLLGLALAGTGAMLAVFAPIAMLFSIVTENYHFMKLFHVGVFAIAGAFGVKVLAEGLSRLAPGSTMRTKALLQSWLLLYCLVGGQLAWTLKPFLGTPYLPATPPFRVETGNIYVSAYRSLMQMGK